MERHGSQFMRKHEPKGKLRDCFPICFGAMEADESACIPCWIVKKRVIKKTRF